MITDKKSLILFEHDSVLDDSLVNLLSSYNIIKTKSYNNLINIIDETRSKVMILSINSDMSLNQDKMYQLISELKKLSLKIVLLMSTNNESFAIKAINQGVYDIHPMPINFSVLDIILSRAFYLAELERNIYQHHSENSKYLIPGVKGISDNMKKTCSLIKKIAPTNISTLLLGESGTGKELLAKALHELSLRRNGPFIAINCAAIPENLLESELFGYERGAFTGATRLTKGKIESAHGGTLFLDEIGDLPLTLQPKLLHFLQERIIERLGSRNNIKIDTRLICATHKNLENKMFKKTFREDLYYRISEITVNIPPLRDRKTDILYIANILLNQYSSELSKNIKGFEYSAKEGLESYHWPGNVREMENKIKRAVILTDKSYIGLDDLDIKVNNNTASFDLKSIREQVEKETIVRALLYSNSNVTKAAQLLGVTRPTLYNLIEKFNLDFEKEVNHVMA